MQYIIGIDFDNTIICYDDIFHNIAVEKQLIPKMVPKSKESVRDYLRNIGKEAIWTELQGYVYGKRMREATAYPGVIDFITSAIKKQFIIYIISHKTRHPYLGPQYNLHAAAYDWLDYNGFFDSNQIGLNIKHVFFEHSLDEKLKRINDMNCCYYIDDLPELFLRENFPSDVNKILFYPHQTNLLKHKNTNEYLAFSSWQDINFYLLNNK